MPKPRKQKDYPELVDWTGRIIREDKRGAIDEGERGGLVVAFSATSMTRGLVV